VVDLELVAHVLRIGLVGARRRVDQVDEEHGDELPLLLRCGDLSERSPATAAEARAGRVRPTAARALNLEGGHPP
jgi:hypothetical protein